ncbi:hypothetical protein PHJA_000423500 [Phtheirospermum japonicum]|uniref:S-protein homolog n=1 Tax=Phtheirospermum japonicum TaxID=374723 RepID=A0A830BDC8_9LAMI|nr:hypothetical protein PHJA_000423500 [Phtheirospermum japonicum]
MLSLYLVNINQALDLFKKERVSIYNDLPQNSKALLVRCQSKDDDLGMRTLYPGQGFDWSFNINIIRSTLFFCHFYWESKQDTFDVFNTKWDLYRVYNYVVRTDGVYLNNDDSTDHKTKSTLFFYHFSWESKQDSFDVFNTKWDLYRVYNYVVRTDGIYLNNDDSTDHKTNYNKIRTW